MSVNPSPDIEPPRGGATLSKTQARQGKTGVGVRYVLVLSTAAAVLALVVVYLVLVVF